MIFERRPVLFDVRIDLGIGNTEITYCAEIDHPKARLIGDTFHEKRELEHCGAEDGIDWRIVDGHFQEEGSRRTKRSSPKPTLSVVTPSILEITM